MYKDKDIQKKVFNYITNKDFNTVNNEQVAFDYMTNKIDSQIFDIFKNEININIDFLNNLKDKDFINQSRWKEVLKYNLITLMNNFKGVEYYSRYIYYENYTINISDEDYFELLEKYVKENTIEYADILIMLSRERYNRDIIKMLSDYNEILLKYNKRMNYCLYRDVSRQLSEKEILEIYKRFNLEDNFFRTMFYNNLTTNVNIIDNFTSILNKKDIGYEFIFNLINFSDKEISSIKNNKNVINIEKRNRLLSRAKHKIKKNKNISKEQLIILLSKIEKMED